MSTESNQDEFSSIDELDSNTQQAPSQPDEPAIPEKYRDKSPQDLLKILQDQDRFIGKQAEEVGFARRMAEEAVRVRQSSAVATPAPKTDELEEVDFFADPKAAVARAVQNSPEVIEARRLAQEMKREHMKQRVQQLHPDVDNIVADPEFATWVQSNRARVMMLQAADRDYDVDTADELISNFKSYKQRNQSATETKAAAIKQQQNNNLKAAQVDSGSRPDAGKKFLRRADIIELHKTNPARYEALLPEIMQAYADGRVR